MSQALTFLHIPKKRMWGTPGFCLKNWKKSKKRGAKALTRNRMLPLIEDLILLVKEMYMYVCAVYEQKTPDIYGPADQPLHSQIGSH